MGDAWGNALQQGISSYCKERSVHVRSFRFESGSNGTRDSIREAVRDLHASGIRVVFTACVGSTECRMVIEEALAVGALDSTQPSWWGFADGLSLSDVGSFSRPVQEALHGSFQVLVSGAEENGRWDNFVGSWADRNTSDYNRYLPSGWQLPEDFFSALSGAKGQLDRLSQIGAYEYDAVVALGLLACKVAPTGPLLADFGTQLWEAKDTLNFTGLSGHVRFTTDGIGNRDPSTANVKLLSWQLQVEIGDGSLGSIWDHPVLARYGEGSWAWEGGSREASGVVFNGGGTAVPDDCDGAACLDSKDGGDGWSPLRYIVVVLAPAGGVVSLILLVFLVRRAMQQCKEARRLMQVHEEQIQARIMGATQRLSTLSFSMCFVPFGKLRQHGKLVPHEEARLAGELVVIDTFDQLHSFLRHSPTVFVSHQWLDFNEPDPNNVHFDAICVALERLCNEFNKNPDELHVWLDYSSIPQVNRVLQKLSIDTLSVYASVCTFFVIVAPETVHLGTGQPCNKETYSRRGWCRLEQWARIAVGGVHNIYLYQKEDEPLHHIKHDADWLQKSIFVCGGDFSVPDDRAKLVDNLLALWGCMLESKDGSPEVTAIYEHVMERRDEVFPAALAPRHALCVCTA